MTAQNHLELSLSPEGALPIGTHSANYGLGGGGVFTTGLDIGALPWITPQVELAYNFVPLQAEAALTIIRGGVGARFGYPVSDTLSLFAAGSAGGF